MVKENLDRLYSAWLINVVARLPQYSMLLERLHSFEYLYSHPMDSNRYEDGISLRYTFALENTIDYGKVASMLDILPCSILEMMVALACKAENMVEQPSFKYEFVQKYILVMIENLGFLDMTNDEFDKFPKSYPEDIIYDFLNGNYDPVTGKGGLFPNLLGLSNYNEQEIWIQFNWYLTGDRERSNRL